jgi:hypothetical protein
MIDFTCPECGKHKSFPNGEAGQVIKCPGCNAYAKVPLLGCELPVARAMRQEFFAQCVILALMILGWAVPAVMIGFTPAGEGMLPPNYFTKCALCLFALAVTLGALFVTVLLPWHRRTLPARFLQLGRLTGKSLREIVVVAGDATAWTEWDDDSELLEWRGNQYYIALVFRDDICQGVQQEARVDVRQVL